MAKGNRDKSPDSRAKRAQPKLKDEGMRIVIDVLLYLVQVHASCSRPVSADMYGGLQGSSRAVSCAVTSDCLSEVSLQS